jgi:alkanesulfonate monooxygenase SsuD/methylene tetrahydromethanopterin reductase-like flavin-dependent oxidoreductase (luciferase family)
MHTPVQLTSPISCAAVAAEATDTIRIAPYVLDNDFRHPSITAREVATLDVLSGGRLDFGIGAGWRQPEYVEAGFAFDPPGVRIARLEEALTVIDALFSGEPVQFKGEHYTLDGFVCRPMPAQQPRPWGITSWSLLGRTTADVAPVIEQLG